MYGFTLKWKENRFSYLPTFNGSIRWVNGYEVVSSDETSTERVRLMLTTFNDHCTLMSVSNIFTYFLHKMLINFCPLFAIRWIKPNKILNSFGKNNLISTDTKYGFNKKYNQRISLLLDFA